VGGDPGVVIPLVLRVLHYQHGVLGNLGAISRQGWLHMNNVAL
jgi:hypothetical protein